MTGVFVSWLCSSIILLNPLQINFPVYHKTLYSKTKNLLKTSFMIGTKYLKILQGIIVNGVQERLSLFITLPTPNETGSNNIYIKGSCLMSFERIFKRCKYMHVAGTIITSLLTNNDNLYLTYIPWLRFSRILQFSSLKPGGFRWVATLCKERDDPQYAWENIKYLFSIKMEISISIFNIVVNFKISGFNKGTAWRKIRKTPVQLWWLHFV